MRTPDHLFAVYNGPGARIGAHSTDRGNNLSVMQRTEVRLNSQGFTAKERDLVALPGIEPGF